MIKLHIPLWELLVHGAVMFTVAVFMIRGHSLKHRLRDEMTASKRAGAVLPRSA